MQITGIKSWPTERETETRGDHNNVFIVSCWGQKIYPIFVQTYSKNVILVVVCLLHLLEIREEIVKIWQLNIPISSLSFHWNVEENEPLIHTYECVFKYI